MADIAAAFGYDAENLGFLIRKGRIAATKRGRQWYTTYAAVERYRREVEDGAMPKGRPKQQ